MFPRTQDTPEVVNVFIRIIAKPFSAIQQMVSWVAGRGGCKYSAPSVRGAQGVDNEECNGVKRDPSFVH